MPPANGCPHVYIRVAGATEDGKPCWLWRRRLARINEAWLDCCFFLYRSEEDAITESSIGGTGFAVSVDHDPPQGPQWGAMYAVTAAHVVAQGCKFARINTRDGTFRVVELGPWHNAPPDENGVLADVSVAILRTGYRANVTAIPIGVGLWRERFKEEDYGIGDPVFMVGRLLNYEGKEMNTPSVRFGNISLVPREAVNVKDVGDCESIFVEMRSQSGYSGSPVFVYKDEPLGPTMRILGVDWGHLRGIGFSGKSVEHAGIVGVTPFWRVIDLLLGDEGVLAERRELEKTLPPPNEPFAVPDSEDS